MAVTPACCARLAALISSSSTTGASSRSTPQPASTSEILEDRYGRRSTIVTSQLPVDQWHALIGDPT
ncbi:hypothetical protein ACVWXL_009303 [Bradyrhizobium sp. GM22.5]